MLEIAVRLNDSKVLAKNGKPFKKRGDIIVAKLAPAIWGSEEKKQFLITELEDSILESKLLDQVSKGEKQPLLVYPYQIMENKLNDKGKYHHITVNTCSRRVDIVKYFKKI